jgi:hypothetical protein
VARSVRGRGDPPRADRTGGAARGVAAVDRVVSYDGRQHSAGLARLVDVVTDLADHEQAVLYFMLWAVTDDGTFWNGHERLGEPLDLRKPWRKVAEDARKSALIEAAFVVARPSLFATVEWVDHADV